MFLLYILKLSIEVHEVRDLEPHDQEVHQDELDELLKLSLENSLLLA